MARSAFHVSRQFYAVGGRWGMVMDIATFFGPVGLRDDFFLLPWKDEVSRLPGLTLARLRATDHVCKYKFSKSRNCLSTNKHDGYTR